MDDPTWRWRESWTTRVLAVGVAAAGIMAASAPRPLSAQEPTARPEPSIVVALTAVGGSGVQGEMRVFSLYGEEGEEEREAGEGMHDHRFEVELRGLEPGEAYPVHLHQGTCADGGPVVLGFETVRAGTSGTGTSRTRVSFREMAAKLFARDDAPPEEHARAEHGRPEVHPPLFVQAHGPDGTPAACGDLAVG